MRSALNQVLQDTLALAEQQRKDEYNRTHFGAKGE